MFQILTDNKENIKEWWKYHTDTVFWASVVFLSSLLLGGLLRLTLILHAHSPITLLEGEKGLMVERDELYKQYLEAGGFPGLVAESRNGKRYYYPWCAGLNRIKEANKVWFDSEKSAEVKGYTLASGCERL